MRVASGNNDSAYAGVWIDHKEAFIASMVQR